MEFWNQCGYTMTHEIGYRNEHQIKIKRLIKISFLSIIELRKNVLPNEQNSQNCV